MLSIRNCTGEIRVIGLAFCYAQSVSTQDDMFRSSLAATGVLNISQMRSKKSKPIFSAGKNEQLQEKKRAYTLGIVSNRSSQRGRDE